jgi:anti-sigma B factor antagonist
MTVRKTKLGVAIYLSPDGALVADCLPAFRQAVDESQAGGASNIVLDLKQVPFIDSQGLEYLWDLSTNLGGRGGSLRIACANHTCKDILRITRVDQTIPVYDDLEAAGRSFL